MPSVFIRIHNQSYIDEIMSNVLILFDSYVNMNNIILVLLFTEY
jgi:hypothetical protein